MSRFAIWAAIPCAVACTFFATPGPAWSQSKASGNAAKEAPKSAPLIFAISEGTSGGIDAGEALIKYQPLVEVISKALNADVSMVLARDFAKLEESMQKQSYDLVMARPSDYPARGIRDYKYAPVATANPDGMCTFIVNKDSPLKKIEDAKGQRIVLPEQVAYMSRFCRAELRDRGINVANEKVQYMREQDTVGFAIEGGMADVGGVASYSGVARNWEKKGHRVLHRSVKQPYFPLIAGPKISPAQVAQMKAALAQLDKSEDGKKVLANIGIQGFVPTSDDKRLLDLLRWLGV